MASVYVVKDNRWGSCETLHVFSTREKAEAFLRPGGDWLRVEEMEVDPEDLAVVRLYRVVMSFERGVETTLDAYEAGHDVRVPGDACASSGRDRAGRTGIVEAESTVSIAHAVETARAYAGSLSWLRA